jgi:hypothetical protein
MTHLSRIATMLYILCRIGLILKISRLQMLKMQKDEMGSNFGTRRPTETY